MTEKDYNPEQKNIKAMKKQTTASKKVAKAPLKKVKEKKEAEEIKETKIVEKEEKLDEKKQSEGEEESKEIKKDEVKKPEKPRKKKDYAIVNSYSLPISTKQSIAVCKFVKNKGIEKAMEDLQQVILKRKAVPMKGEIPHRKGKIMSGRFPKNTSEHFIKLLKSLSAISNLNGLNNPVITEAISNMAQRPFGSGGRIRRKRTHVKLVARDRIKKNKEGKE